MRYNNSYMYLLRNIGYESHQLHYTFLSHSSDITTKIHHLTAWGFVSWLMLATQLVLGSEGNSFDLQPRQAAHWAWQPVTNAQPPPVDDASWPRSSIDHFILAKLEAHDLHPAADANPYTLVRRAYFDLIGLPPTPDQVEAFVADPSATAWAQLIDHLLEQPQFGERWARHWLDLMRYAETRGHEFDFDVPNAWQYRDYVIRAFNADIPYDQLVTEHIAGDLLEHPRHHPLSGFNESVLATGFWYLGEWVHSPVDILQDEADRLDNAIDVFSKAFLGLTVSCARCHDHKFDAISQHDYYALVGYLQSSSYRQVRFESHEQNSRVAQNFDQLRRETGRRIATQIAARCTAQVEPLDELLGAASQWVKQGSEQPLLHKLAAQTDLPVEPLRQWGIELALAADDQQHPLYRLGLAAVGHPATAIERSRTKTADSAAQKGHPGESLWDAYEVVANFDDDQTPWMVDGPAFGEGPVRRGEVLAGNSVDAPIAEIVNFGRAQLRPQLAHLTLTSGTVRDPGALSHWSERTGRTLRTPTVELSTGKLYYLLRGGAQIHVVVDSHRLIHGPLHGSLLKVVPGLTTWRWVEHDLTPYQTHGAHIEFSPHEDDPLELAMVLQGDTLPTRLPPALDIGLRTTQNPTAASSTSLLELSRHYAALLREAIHHLAVGTLADSATHQHLATWVAAHPQLWSDEADQEIGQLLTSARKQQDKILRSLRTVSATAPAIWDGTGEDQRLFIRGNPETPGPKIPRQLLTALVGTPAPAPTRGSGRLKLAQQMLDPANPFPARVMANRIWQHLLGRGIVPTVDNFGVLGQPPTHPELLDYLATQLVREGWSLKQLIRTIMLSRTYQMSSQTQAQATALDPTNQWFHHRPLRRLEAEAIRDAILTVSGRLDRQLYGPSVPVHLTPFMQGRGRPKVQGPLDGDGRRSIYLTVRRNFLSPMMLAFDTPQPARPMGRRNQSNVPAQALILMNDPFVAQQSLNFAKRLLQHEPDVNRRIDQLYLRTLARPPQAPERAAVHQFLTRESTPIILDSDKNITEEGIWTDLCQVMFNLKEFIYIP
jgi:hypothetical protein